MNYFLRIFKSRIFSAQMLTSLLNGRFKRHNEMITWDISGKWSKQMYNALSFPIELEFIEKNKNFFNRIYGKFKWNKASLSFQTKKCIFAKIPKLSRCNNFFSCVFSSLSVLVIAECVRCSHTILSIRDCVYLSQCMFIFGSLI